MQRHRYYIVQESQPRMSLRHLIVALVWIAIFMLATLFFTGFFYLGSAELESERTTFESLRGH